MPALEGRSDTNKRVVVLK